LPQPPEFVVKNRDAWRTVCSITVIVKVKRSICGDELTLPRFDVCRQVEKSRPATN
jgi:hypothetical protein